MLLPKMASLCPHTTVAVATQPQDTNYNLLFATVKAESSSFKPSYQVNLKYVSIYCIGITFTEPNMYFPIFKDHHESCNCLEPGAYK